MSGYDRYIDHADSGMSTVEVQRSRLQNGKRAPLRVLLEANREREASEPRDMIYALRSVIEPKVAHGIPVDYEARLGTVYANAARTCIETEKALTVLGSVEYRRNEAS